MLHGMRRIEEKGMNSTRQYRNDVYVVRHFFYHKPHIVLGKLVGTVGPEERCGPTEDDKFRVVVRLGTSQHPGETVLVEPLPEKAKERILAGILESW